MGNPNLRRFELVPGFVVAVEITPDGWAELRRDGYNEEYIGLEPSTDQAQIDALFPSGYIEVTTSVVEQAKEVTD